MGNRQWAIGKMAMGKLANMQNINNHTNHPDSYRDQSIPIAIGKSS
jgi:hypothetical protein